METFRYFDLAQRVAKKSNHPTYKLSCIIYKKKRIVAIGYNQIKTHTKSPNEWKMLHAEIHSILGADPSDLNGAPAFVYMENRKGKVGRGKPCLTCENPTEERRH